MLKKSYSMMDKNGILYGIGVGPGEPERKHVMHIKSHMRYVLK